MTIRHSLDKGSLFQQSCDTFWDNIEINFISELFATSNNLIFSDDRINATFDENRNKWNLNCKLGDCGMTAKTVIEDDIR